MQLGEAKTKAEFPSIILYNKQKKTKQKLLLKRSTFQEFFYLNPQNFLSAQSNQDLSSPLSLAKLALKITLKKNQSVGVCVPE